MKVFKKIFVYFFVAVLCFSSVVFSYRKADSCEAVSYGIGLGLAVISVGVVLYGSYCVATDEELQEEVKQTFADYKNMTVEGAKKSYDINKQLFNDFVAYAEENGAGSMCLYSSAGSSYTVAELSQAGFPDFNEWDDYFKKSSGSGGGWKNIFDKILLGADLIGLMKSFCNDEFYEDGVNGQLFYTGEDGYVNAETGELNVYFENRMYEYDENTFNTYVSTFVGNVDDLVSYAGSDYGDFRICAYAKKEYCYNSWHSISNGRVLNDVWRIDFVACYRRDDVNGGVKNVFTPYLDISYNGGTSQRQYYTFGSFGLKYFDSSTHVNYLYNIDNSLYDEELGRYLSYKDFPYFPDYISSNIPFFANYSDAYNYLMGNDREPTNSLGTTPSDLFLSNYSGDYITVNNVITDVNNYYDVDGDDPSATPLPDVTIEPLPTLPDDDGSNTTNNYIINITNILQPIQQTVTNIYNFFIIDTEKIVLEIDNIDVTPASKFTNFVQTFSNLKNIFSDSTQDELNVAGSSQKGIVYPILKVQCPQILIDFLPDNDDVVLFEDDIAYIILCDCGKYAVQFGAVRLILKAVMWFGFIFYVLRELKVVITLSS